MTKEDTLGDTVETPATTALARWLARATRAQDVRVSRYERLPGGAIQDNFLLDVDIRGGPWQGEHAFVLRTDAPTGVAASLSRAQEFAVLRVAHAAGVTAPKPLFLCRDTTVLGREFFIMKRIPGRRAGSPAHARARAGSRRCSARPRTGCEPRSHSCDPSAVERRDKARRACVHGHSVGGR